MSRTKLPLPQERIAPFDLEAFVNEAATLNQSTLEAFTTPFPKGPDRWLSHDQFTASPDRVHRGRRGRGGTQLADRRDDRSALHPRPLCPVLFQGRRPLL